jgi:hypothetical protein
MLKTDSYALTVSHSKPAATEAIGDAGIASAGGAGAPRQAREE